MDPFDAEAAASSSNDCNSSQDSLGPMLAHSDSAVPCISRQPFPVPEITIFDASEGSVGPFWDQKKKLDPHRALASAGKTMGATVGSKSEFFNETRFGADRSGDIGLPCGACVSPDGRSSDVGDKPISRRETRRLTAKRLLKSPWS